MKLCTRTLTVLALLFISITPALAADDTLVVTETGQVGIGTATPTAALEVVGDIKLTGEIIPAGFTSTAGVVHTIDKQAAAKHTDATMICAQKGAEICIGAQYKLATLGWLDEIDPFADDHMFWNGSTSWNVIMACPYVSLSLGATVEAGSHTSNAYVFNDITTCADRGTRLLEYYCCK